MYVVARQLVLNEKSNFRGLTGFQIFLLGIGFVVFSLIFPSVNTSKEVSTVCHNHHYVPHDELRVKNNEFNIELLYFLPMETTKREDFKADT
jgi:hypothetical protein